MPSCWIFLRNPPKQLAIISDNKITEVNVRSDIVADPTSDPTFKQGVVDFGQADESGSNGRFKSVREEALALSTDTSDVGSKSTFKEKSEKHVSDGKDMDEWDDGEQITEWVLLKPVDLNEGDKPGTFSIFVKFLF